MALDTLHVEFYINVSRANIWLYLLAKRKRALVVMVIATDDPKALSHL